MTARALSLEHRPVQILAFFDGSSCHRFLVIKTSGVIDRDFSQVVVDVSCHG